MANIPVEHDKSRPWWLWLLGLLLLLLLIWLLVGLLDGDDDEVAVVEDEVETVDPIVTEPADPVGMDMSNLYVTRVISDRAFYVAPSETETGMETLVILNEVASPDAAGIEGQVDINEGQRVNLASGTMGTVGDENLAGMGFDDAAANAMTPGTEVIRIDGTAVEILDAPMGVDEVEVGT